MRTPLLAVAALGVLWLLTGPDADVLCPWQARRADADVLCPCGCGGRVLDDQDHEWEAALDAANRDDIDTEA